MFFNQIENVLIEPGMQIDRRKPANLTEYDEPIFKDYYRYHTLDSYIRSYGKVLVTYDSVIYKKGMLAIESVAAPEQSRYYRFRHLAKTLLRGKRVKLPKGPKYLLVTDSWSPGHYHWFTEVLPKLFLMRGAAPDYTLLLPRSGYVERIGIDSMHQLNIRFGDVKMIDPTSYFEVPELYYVSRIAKPGQLNDRIMRSMNKEFLKLGDARKHRIYISRKKAEKRMVLNEPELISLLKSYDFEIIHAEDLDLSEQIDVFANSEVLIGMHGAGLTNCLFMHPGSIVVELRKREKNYGYWHLADALGHKYFYYHGVPDSKQSLIGHGCNLTIDVAEFESSLLAPLVAGHFEQ